MHEMGPNDSLNSRDRKVLSEWWERQGEMQQELPANDRCMERGRGREKNMINGQKKLDRIGKHVYC